MSARYNEDGMRKEERVNLDVITVPRASSCSFVW